jgi:hypothetical protein
MDCHPRDVSILVAVQASSVERTEGAAIWEATEIREHAATGSARIPKHHEGT